MGQIHLISGPERRRRWGEERKRAIVAAAFAPGSSSRRFASSRDPTTRAAFSTTFWTRAIPTLLGVSIHLTHHSTGYIPPVAIRG